MKKIVVLSLTTLVLLIGLNACQRNSCNSKYIYYGRNKMTVVEKYKIDSTYFYKVEDSKYFIEFYSTDNYNVGDVIKLKR